MTVATGDETGVLFKYQHWKTLKSGFPMLMPKLNTSYHMMTPVTLCSTNVYKVKASPAPQGHTQMKVTDMAVSADVLMWGRGTLVLTPCKLVYFMAHAHNIFLAVLLLRTVNTVLQTLFISVIHL